ncbi:helix-turn-helix domain-containing protein [Paenibacillus camelliae]|uniref:helix-turn-helix domain-containing protein n=1 Tax=Paenibacillus camelliae TaxID=512410 RepID=UPI00203D3942|nr:helix-turn-helix domain-containing protein [Paenibacillus camelliae]MCM3635049.1 helix-turn-helix domain-containing protein [Paenibacillus camelliae]
MKLLIVDDEEHVREGIELSIDWSKHGINQILMADNGLEALELVRQHHPELIISDMSMHIMDGPQFLEKLREEGWTSKVIVLSGYQQFTYTRATLLANGIDYLLKPFKISDLDQAIEKACKQIREEQQARLKELSNNFRLNEVNNIVNEQRFASLIEEEQNGSRAISDFLATLGIDPDRFYVITYLPRNKDAIVKQYYERDEQLFNFAVKNIIEELFTPLGAWYSLQYQSFIILFVSTRMLPDDIEKSVYRLQEAWQRTLRLSSFVGFRSVALAADKLQQVLLEEKSVILNSNVLSSSKQIEKSEASLFFIDKERVIVEAVRSKNKQYLHELVDEFTRELTAGGRLTLRELQHYTVEINLLLMRIYVQLSDDRFHATMPLWLAQMEEWSARLKQTFSDIVELIDYSKVESGSVQSIAAVRNYINDHMKEDITLASLAEQFHFSPQYLAKRFKEEYQTTIMNYLSQLRMDKACSLLVHTDLTIHEVAEESGFEELNYFSKVFKKHIGMTPTAYRKTYKP